jgi:maleylpyruvate isomerase
VPQLFNARRSGADLSPYPALIVAGDTASALPAFRAAQPEAQPDADA